MSASLHLHPCQLLLAITCMGLLVLLQGHVVEITDRSGIASDVAGKRCRSARILLDAFPTVTLRNITKDQQLRIVVELNLSASLRQARASGLSLDSTFTALCPGPPFNVQGPGLPFAGLLMLQSGVPLRLHLQLLLLAVSQQTLQRLLRDVFSLFLCWHSRSTSSARLSALRRSLPYLQA